MFNPSQLEVRNFFFDTYAKATQSQELTALEKIAYAIILEHPEYHTVLENKIKYLEFVWSVENGATNPFLHLSMHLTIAEQSSIDQPPGICQLFTQLQQQYASAHEAEHQLIDCLSEMLWQAQRNNTGPDAQIYFNCIRHKLGIIQL